MKTTYENGMAFIKDENMSFHLIYRPGTVRPFRTGLKGKSYKTPETAAKALREEHTERMADAEAIDRQIFNLCK